jgi:DNA-binding NarL/FixJ family response regulator
MEALALALRAVAAVQDRGRLAALLAEIRSMTAGLACEPARATLRLAEGWAAQAEGDHEVARQAFEDAADSFARCGAPFEQASAQLEVAQELAALGHRELGGAEAQAAREAFERLGATAAAQRAASLAGDLSRPAARSWPGGLTRREAEVVRLLAQGLPNRSIARRLSVSEHTVKRHVANILGKLDLPSRAAAAAFAARHGLQ